MSEKPKKGINLKIVIIVLLLLIVVGGAAFGGMMLAGKKSTTTTAAPAHVEEASVVTFSLEEEFLVNLIDEDGKRYLKAKLDIGYEENEELTLELEKKESIIRDLVISTLRAKKTTDISAKGVEAIKNELIARINPTLTEGKISHIYFNDLLVQ